MAIDWNIVIDIAAPILTGVGGLAFSHWYENRPSLISYYGHISAFRFVTDDRPQNVFTHTVVIRNVGRKSITGVRVHHRNLPHFNIFPSVQHSVEDLPDGSKDIVIPTMVPKEELTISYLYFPPLIASDVNHGIKFDGGFAKEVHVLLQQRSPKWLIRILLLLMIVGLMVSVYLLYLLIARAWSWLAVV